MWGKLAAFLLSLLLTNWLYNEAVIFFPQTRDYLQRVTQVLRIPTHNEWAGIVKNKEARVLSRELRAEVNFWNKRRLARSGGFSNRLPVVVETQRSPAARPVLLTALTDNGAGDGPMVNGSEIFGDWIPTGWHRFNFL